MLLFFLLDAAWVRSRAERPSVSYTKVTSKVAWIDVRDVAVTAESDTVHRFQTWYGDYNMDT